MREIEWTQAALEDMAALDKGIARRVKQAVERFADTGAALRIATHTFIGLPRLDYFIAEALPLDFIERSRIPQQA